MWEIASLTGGFVMLILGAGYLVDNASALASKLGIPNLVIGLTIVAFGTSTPELVVSIISSIKGNPEITTGNIVGSNIFNILVILGISALISPLRVKSTTTWIEVPLCLLSALLVLILAYSGPGDSSGYNLIGRTEGFILLLIFMVFIFYNFFLSWKEKPSEAIEVREQSMLKSVTMIVIGLVLLIGGGRFVVLSVVEIAREIGLSERIIGLTIVATGTSLPELVTSVIAAKKGNTDIAIGNIVGSNIFNIFLVIGISAVLNPVRIAPGTGLDLLVNIFASFLLFIFIFTGRGRMIERWEALVFILAYLVYFVYIIF